MPNPQTAADILAAAVGAIGGVPREGQERMAQVIEQAIAKGEHLLVQAGTGTGKSLGYLAPALRYVLEHPGHRVVVATATLALQAQLAKKDIPAALDAVERVSGRRPKFSVLKGRSNYACLHRVRGGVAVEQESLLGGFELADTLKGSAAPESALGAEVVGLREWAEEQVRSGGLADRDEAPSHSSAGWAQVSIPVRECLGAQRCPFGAECFAEAARDRARQSELVVTNHALLAIDAMHGGTALPEHDLVIVDEAHELGARVTGAAAHELSPQQVERVAKRCLPWLDDELGLDLLEAAEDLRSALDDAPLAQLRDPDSALVAAFRRVRDSARAGVSKLSGGEASDADRRQAGAALGEVFDVAEQVAQMHPNDVIYVVERERFGREARVAPLSVAGLMREQIMTAGPVVLTSATLQVGGSFESVARAVGLRPDERVAEQDDTAGDRGDEALPWRGLDVGSPFDYRRQGILYVAKSMPSPSREGISEAVLTEIAELVWAAGGRTLGLFASQRAAEAAARHVRTELPKLTVLCQGDAHLAELTRRFVDEPEVSLFGTLSLWQGIDVPGDTCELVIIDKIPFPRPDEPLMLARQEAVAKAGGNGFMQVAAAHAALLLAQGSGRLIRRLSDKGVVAVLDPRLLTARYGSYLRASMPAFWLTTDREVVVQALRRLSSARSEAG